MKKMCRECGLSKEESMFKIARNTNPEMIDVCMICRRSVRRKKYAREKRV